MTRHVNPYFQKEDENSKATVGSEKRPALVQVQDEKRADEIRKVCEENSWFVEVTIKPEEPENISAVDQLLNPPETVTAEKVGRNDPCPCGSGKKYKQCHGK